MIGWHCFVALLIKGNTVSIGGVIGGVVFGNIAPTTYVRTYRFESM